MSKTLDCASIPAIYGGSWGTLEMIKMRYTLLWARL
jgi:hypothetical protein